MSIKISKGVVPTAQKVVVYGVEGIGKSTFASHFPDPIFSDTEGSTKQLDVARFETVETWGDLVEQAKYIKSHQPCSTYVIDSIDWAENLCLNDICKSSGKKSIEDFGYGKGYTIHAEKIQAFLNLLQEIVDNGINVVLVAHAQVKKIERPDDENSFDRYELKLQKKTAPIVKEWADMLLFANYQTYTQKNDDGKVKARGKERRMYTTYNPVWDAKNRHNLPDELPFTFDSIASLIPSFSKKEKSEKAKENNLAKIDAMTEEDHEDFVEIKTIADGIRSVLAAENTNEAALINFLQQKGLIDKSSLDELDEETLKNISSRLDKIIAQVIENEDLPF